MEEVIETGQIQNDTLTCTLAIASNLHFRDFVSSMLQSLHCA